MSTVKISSPPLEVKRFQWVISRDELCGIRREAGGQFSGDESEDNEAVESKSFSFGEGIKSKWSLRLDDDEGPHYRLDLVPAAENPTSVDITFKVGVIMKDGTEGNVKDFRIFSGKDYWGYPEFLEKNVKRDDSYWRKNMLIIFCDLQAGRKIGKLDILSQDLSRMFDNGKLTDFTLVVGKEEFKVHRAVLASRSPVFEKMFQQETKEKQDGRVEIEDLDVVGMKGLLQFIYSGEVKDLEEIAVNVLPAADKYGVDELKAICNKLTVKDPPLESKRFKWSIKSNEFPNTEDNSIKSPSFSFGEGNIKSKWSVSLKNLETYGDGHHAINLVPAPKNPTSVDIKFKVGMIKKDGSETNVKHCQIFSGTDVWGYPEFLERAFSFGEYFRENNKKFTIFCDLQTDRKTRVLDNLSQDLNRMLDSGNLTDFTLVVAEEELKVHKAVLASRSPVFEAMFEHDMKEKQNGRVEIMDEDLDVIGMKGLLQFIYSGKVKDLEEIAVNVLPAANKYGMDELKTLCEKTICNKLTVKEAANVLGMADHYSAEYLKAEALKFINKNAVGVVEEPGFHDEFAKESPQIYKEIFKSFAKRVNDCERYAVKQPNKKRIKLQVKHTPKPWMLDDFY